MAAILSTISTEVPCPAAFTGVQPVGQKRIALVSGVPAVATLDRSNVSYWAVRVRDITDAFTDRRHDAVSATIWRQGDSYVVDHASGNGDGAYIVDGHADTLREAIELAYGSAVARWVLTH